MKVDYHLYRLLFKENFGTVGKQGARHGALLRITFDDGLIGYCDCHPWVELGDLPLAKQLSSLKTKETTPLLQCSLQFARLDAEARQEGQSVFKNIDIPLSHQLVHLSINPQELFSQGITHFKVKTGDVPSHEIAAMSSWIEINPKVHLRLDFNEKLNRQDFLEYWNQMPLEVKKRVDFVEDPYPYDPETWSNDQKSLNISFAADHCSSRALNFPKSARYIIHKPAVEFPPHLMSGKNQLVITSYLDHPFGQMCAAYCAGKLKIQYPDQVEYCGLLTHRCYEENIFITCVNSIGPQLLPTEGTGFGFDNILKDIEWQNL